MTFSLDLTQKAVVNQISVTPASVLDIGSGTGALLGAIRERYPGASLTAVDYTDEFMSLKDCDLRIVDLNDGVLPFPDDVFELVTITEVVEHLENYHAIIREIYRVLKPGGQVIVTTPNILNLRSRLRFFTFGFWNLFGPLPFTDKELETTNGHITPVHYFHLVFSMTHTGYQDIALSGDKIQKSSIALYALFFILLKPIEAWFNWRERNRYMTIDRHNETAANQVNSFIAMTCRSLVVSARKPRAESKGALVHAERLGDTTSERGTSVA